jgi:2-polyprenyl-3-methyl-5-hydroxy-6-metoxy-1,4-benzoquinol methylase
MSETTRKDIQKKVNQLSRGQDWNHMYELPHGVKTRQHKIDSPGFNLNKGKRLKEIYDTVVPLDNKTVLDVACSDGYFSIQCAKDHNARWVVGMDLDDLRIRRANFVKELVGVENVEFSTQDLYELDDSISFDVVLGLGLLHRIPDMEACVEKMCKIGKTLILEFKTLSGEESVKKDLGGKTKSNNLNSLFCVPTKQYVVDELANHGFTHTRIFDDNSHLNYPRTIIVASKTRIK